MGEQDCLALGRLGLRDDLIGTRANLPCGFTPGSAEPPRVGKPAHGPELGSLEFSAGELEILRQAVRAVDTADRIERELRKQPLSVQGYNGQPRPNPLIRMLQDQQLLIRRLVDSLNIPLPEEEVGLTAKQKHAQHAAQIRWGRPRGAS